MTPPPAVPAKAAKCRTTGGLESPPPVGVEITENLLDHMDTLADTAPKPDTAAKEKAASTREKGANKGCRTKATKRRMSQKVTPAPAEESADDQPLLNTLENDTILDTPEPAAPATAKGPKTTKPKKGANKKEVLRQPGKAEEPIFGHQFHPHSHSITGGIPQKKPNATCWPPWATNPRNSRRISLLK